MSIHLPDFHPLCDAPADVILIYVIAQEVGVAAAEQALAIRLKAMAAHGDKKAQKLIAVGEYLGTLAQGMRFDCGVAMPETFGEAARRLIGFAAMRGELNPKMVNDLFGVGLINKTVRDQIFADFELAA